jgi:hypothetical protein
MVVEGVEEDEFKSIDALRSRSAGDVLFIRREQHHRTLAFVLNLVARYYRFAQSGTQIQKRLVSRDTLFVLEMRPEIRESVAKTAAFSTLGGHTVAAAVHHLASRIDPERADVFFDRVLTGPDSDDDPACLLRNAFLTSKRAGQERMLALTIRAWNAYYASRPLKYLRWRTEGATPERFPVLEGLVPEDGDDLQRQRPPNREITVSPDDLEVRVEVITPRIAEDLINRQAQNRNIVSRVVEKYARDMQAGNWGLNGQTIKISESGKLLDGQHRCAAAVKTGTSFEAIVVRGLPDEVFDTLDAGASRSLGQVLADRGEKSTFALAAALQKLWLYEQDMPTLHTLRGSHAELLQVLERHPDLRGSVLFCVSKLRDVLSGAIGATSHYIASKTSRERADEFVERVGNGVELKADSPILLLREAMFRNRSNKRSPFSELEKWALTIKALNAFFENRSMKLLTWRPGNNEAFPRILETERGARRGHSRARGSRKPRTPDSGPVTSEATNLFVTVGRLQPEATADMGSG